MILSELLVFTGDVIKVFGGCLWVQQAGYHHDTSAGIQHVDDWVAVVRGNLDGCVDLAGGGPSNQERHFELEPLHLFGHGDHFIQAGCDETRQTNDISLLLDGSLEDLLAWSHDPKINDTVVVALQDNTHNVLSNVVHVTLDGGQEDGSVIPSHSSWVLFQFFFLFLFHEWNQVGHSLLHHTSRFDDLRQKHLSSTEEVTHNIHTTHEWAFNDSQRVW
mmetsp:Transcript_8136/g.11201  ORF Transcript_8136/g.11201 Transcript_8136/m.11201 type:complete len:218 (-) Transcript_8136:2100-2753(-)